MDFMTLRPLAPPRQKLTLIDPALAAAAKTAVELGTIVAGNLLSQWVWRKYVQPKRKAKVSAKFEKELFQSTQVVTVITERTVRMKRVRLNLRGK
jgi:membrane protein implicated in regulation of membrane protease activity